MADLENKYDIEKYRKRKQRKKMFTRILLLFLVLVVGVIVFFVIEAISQNNTYKNEENVTFPISLSGNNPVDLNVTNNHLVVTGESETTFYKENAVEEKSLTHGFSQPVVIARENKVLTYDQGRYGLRVDTKNGKLHSLTNQTQILFCQMSSSGYTAVGAFEERYNGSLSIYDKNMTRIYKYNDSKDYIMDFDFISNQKGVLAAQSTNNGAFSAVLYGLDFTKEKGTEFFETRLDGLMVYSVSVKGNGNIVVVGDTATVVLDQKGNEMNRYSYTSQIRQIYDTTDDTVLIFENTVNANESDLLVLFDDGKAKAEQKLNGVSLDLFCDDDRILVLDKNNIYEYDHALNLISTYPNSNDYLEVVRLNSKVYAMGSSQLDCLTDN